MGTSRQILLADSVLQFMFTAVYLTGAAFLAFMLGFSEYLLVYHTSSLTLSVSGVIKVNGGRKGVEREGETESGRNWK